jgi:hypothetical protein
MNRKEVVQMRRNKASEEEKKKRVQVHFEIDEKQWRQFQTKLNDMGFVSASEYLRAQVRHALSTPREDLE